VNVIRSLFIGGHAAVRGWRFSPGKLNGFSLLPLDCLRPLLKLPHLSIEQGVTAFVSFGLIANDLLLAAELPPLQVELDEGGRHADEQYGEPHPCPYVCPGARAAGRVPDEADRAAEHRGSQYGEHHCGSPSHGEHGSDCAHHGGQGRHAGEVTAATRPSGGSGQKFHSKRRCARTLLGGECHCLPLRSGAWTAES
jgi:hypothetical protein